MKKIYHIVIIVYLLSSGFTVFGRQTDTLALPGPVFDTIIKRGFARVVTGENDAPGLANYISFNPSDGKFSMNVFKMFNTRVALSFTAAGGLLNDNIGVLFDDGKLNTNTDLGLRLHWQIGRPSVSFTAKDRILIEEKTKRLQFRKEAAIRSIELGLDTIVHRLYTIDSLIKTNPGPGLMAQLNNERDSLLFIRRLDNPTSADLVIFGLGKDSYRKKLSDEVIESYDKEIFKLRTNIPLAGQTFKWITLITNWNRQSYRQYDSTVSMQERIKPKKMDAFNFGAEFTLLHYDAFLHHTHFLNIGVLKKRTNNLEDLSTSKVTDSRTIRDGEYERSISSEYNVYTDAIEKFNVINPYVNFYYLYDKNVSIGAHLFADAQFRNNDKQLVNAGAGVIYGFNNKKDNTVLNVELFLRFKDLTNIRDESQNRLWDHSQIGISFALPFIIFNN